MKFELSKIILGVATLLLPATAFNQLNDALVNDIIVSDNYELFIADAGTNMNAFSNDADGDGVKDKRDDCPDTPEGVAVDENGCPVDADNDKIADYLDKCAMVPGLAKLNGCPDQDKDDIADKDDACPEVPGLARFQGCPDSDSDGDGIQDAMDKCPNMKGLDMFKGCPDTDNDGVDDANDTCPGTEAGIKVDALGCSADADRDGIIDSDDKCPDTPKGIKVDMKGCPADTDGDGVIDTNDKCPTTKGEGSTNGCPVIKEDVKKAINSGDNLSSKVNENNRKAHEEQNWRDN